MMRVPNKKEAEAVRIANLSFPGALARQAR
jgi:hypothetical protein